MKFKTKKELYNFLDNFNFTSKKTTKLSSVYFLIAFNNNVCPIYFSHFKNVWFAVPCELYEFTLPDNELIDSEEETINEQEVQQG